MRRTLLIAGAFAALCITSCKKNEVIIPETKTDLSISATPYLQIQNASTKSFVEDDVNGTEAVNSLEVFVFRTDAGHEGELIAYQANNSGSNVNITLNTKEGGVDYNFVAFANNYDQVAGDYKYDLAGFIGSAQGGLDMKDNMKAVVTDLKKNFFMEESDLRMDLLMICDSTTTISPTTTDISLTVERVVSKIELRKVSVDFPTEALKANDLVIDNIYVTNIAKESTWGRTAGAVGWYNETRFVSGDCDKILFDAVNYKINDGATRTAITYDTGANPHRFFAYINDATVKKTKLVIECTYKGAEKTYYVTELPPIKPGYAYIVRNAIIKGLGSEDPDKVTIRSNFNVTVSVRPWIEVLLGENHDGDVIL